MLTKIKFLTAGESHGRGLLGILDGIPSGLKIEKEFIENFEENKSKSLSIEYAKKRAMHHHSIAHECLNNLKNSPEVDVLRELTDFQLIRIN